MTVLFQSSKQPQDHTQLAVYLFSSIDIVAGLSTVTPLSCVQYGFPLSIFLYPAAEAQDDHEQLSNLL